MGTWFSSLNTRPARANVSSQVKPIYDRPRFVPISNFYAKASRVHQKEHCRYNINGPFDTPGRLYKDGEKILYQNDLGSNGIVTNDGKTFTMQNTFTGNNYKVEVKKQP